MWIVSFPLSNSTYISSFNVVPGVMIEHGASNHLARWVLRCGYYVLFHQTFSMTAFSHAEYAPQTAVLTIHRRIKSYPTAQLSNHHSSRISCQRSAEAYEQVCVISDQTHYQDVTKRSYGSVLYLLQAKAAHIFFTNLMESVWLRATSHRHLILISMDANFSQCR